MRRMMWRPWVLVAGIATLLQSCGEDGPTGPGDAGTGPVPVEGKQFSLRVAGFNYAAFTWRVQDDTAGVARIVEVRVSPDSLSEAQWDDHPLGEEVWIHNPHQDSFAVVVHGLAPSSDYVASWRLILADSSRSAIGPWLAFRTPAPPQLPELVRIPAGPFVMGSDLGEGWDPESPETILELPEYYMERTEVTNALFWRFMSEGGYENPAFWSVEGWRWKELNEIDEPRGWSSHVHRIGLLWPDHPVGGIGWFEAQAYAAWAGRRLPTEAEWEKAARGGCELAGSGACETADERLFPWGSSTDPHRFNHLDSGDPYEPGTTPAGFYDGRSAGGYQTLDAGSPYGIYDLAGNMAEWTSTRAQDYPYDPGDGREAPPETGIPMVLRGGSWSSPVEACRCAARAYLESHDRSQFAGMRCAADDAGGGP